ncbi:NAD-binding protein, partial [Streptomyces sp. UNOB3_S3]|uniref:NAD-binding protein n=1 Tax=Streptomyces sp. UNOB3_S3 TaxID=2871682 RepID=UPI001E4250D5
MVVCGDDGLAHRLAAELSGVHGERVALVLPPARDDRRRPVAMAGRAAALFGRVTGAVGRGANGPGGASGPSGSSGPGGSSGPNGVAGTNGSAGGPVRVVEAAEPDDEALTEAGVERAAALALVYDDDETNVNAAMRARRLNPRLRLVIRLYNRRLGQYLEELLDQAALMGDADAGTTTVLSDADTAAPALVAAAVTGTSKAIEAGDLLLRAVERPASSPGPGGDDAAPGTVTLALLSDGDGPVLLPDERQV